MTVGELIETMKHFNEDLEVNVRIGSNFEEFELFEEHVKMRKSSGNVVITVGD